MEKKVLINIEFDENTKETAEKICNENGITLENAIKLFVEEITKTEEEMLFKVLKPETGLKIMEKLDVLSTITSLEDIETIETLNKISEKNIQDDIDYSEETDTFYSEENQEKLAKMIDDIKSGKEKLTPHELIEENN